MILGARAAALRSATVAGRGRTYRPRRVSLARTDRLDPPGSQASSSPEPPRRGARDCAPRRGPRPPLSRKRPPTARGQQPPRAIRRARTVPAGSARRQCLQAVPAGMGSWPTSARVGRRHSEHGEPLPAPATTKLGRTWTMFGQAVANFGTSGRIGRIWSEARRPQQLVGNF